MIEASNALVEYRQQIGRSESFSTISSSVAAAEIMQQQAELVEKPIMASTNPVNMKFQNSTNIHLGQKVINIDYSEMKNVEHQQPVRRNGSFSTVTSSVAARDIIEQYTQLRKNLPQSSDDPESKHTSMNIRFKNSLGVHVGNILYHIHYYTKFSRRNSFMSNITDLVKRLKPSSSIEIIASKRNIILLISIIVLALLTSASLITYFIVWYSNDSGDDLSTTASTPIPRPNLTTPTTPKTDIENPEYFMTRDKWGADEPKSSPIPDLEIPIKRIIIGHTGGEFCETQTDCIQIVKFIQSQNPDLDDIPYNFLIGGDGKVYEGRGFNYEGQHTQNKDATEYNSIGICIAFIGNYQSTTPSLDQIELLKMFINDFSDRELIAQHYNIFSQDDLRYSDVTAEKLNEAVGAIPNYYSIHKIHHRNEWGALDPKSKPENFITIPDEVTLAETLGSICNKSDECILRMQQIQQSSFDKGMIDIEYNFVFSANGIIFEGRGWDTQGDYLGVNYGSIRLGVIGDYSPSVLPGDDLINRTIAFTTEAKVLGKIAENATFTNIL